ncbi:MAG: hypothetical protein COW71_08875 [Ignavibacteriales bacterium CG18_big_fil_WC_8_21_14_2_50_31_20]|nr:MAG: hypothetical protein COW71_08875 [Ignavibacteriales bacterium CG18_big_fil_WC_8_21_14_2_50_31_20]
MMKKIFSIILLLPFLVSLPQSSFSFDDYKKFIQSNANLSASQLLQTNNPGEFKANIVSDWNTALFADSIEIKFKLTEDEKLLINKNGFVVTERLGKESFISTIEDIYRKDLPLFITSDMVLHAFHKSYDSILKDVEQTFLLPKLKDFLHKLVLEIPNLEGKYQSDYMKKRLVDVDLYLGVARKILDKNALPYYSENELRVTSFMLKIQQEEFETMPFFSETERKIDFSQFKPRGHYDDEFRPELADYFRAMIWLGRMELYLIAPNALVKPKLVEVQRQAIMSNLILELEKNGNLEQNYKEIENVIEIFVGEQDNVTFSNLDELKSKMGFALSISLSDTNYFKAYQDTLANQTFAAQKILSQVLMHNPESEDEIKPASAFLMFGQRFVIDSYVAGSVVYDKVEKLRMLPSTLDILFALGNDASAQLLVSELEKFNYAPNLVGVRYLVDSYNPDFWNSTVYNGWLNSIRKLNPPKDRTIFPNFMQTAAWWQQKMNSQLGSWTELRHDNILYAKQSYSGGYTCFYPYGYVEPVPELFASLKLLAKNFNAKMLELNFSSDYMREYFTNLYDKCDTLQSIAQKELDGIDLLDSEIKFMKRTLTNPQTMCGDVSYEGWYPKLFYSDMDADYLVVDYHTAPTDEVGNMVGWVAHSGTGKIDLAIMNTKLTSGENVAFVGPVYSYHEYTTTNFFRITDTEWSGNYINRSTRPEWTKIYLANIDGNKQESTVSLVTNVDDENNKTNIPKTHIIAQNYPNPFNPSTTISFVVPAKLSNNKTKLTVFNIQGEEVKVLVNHVLPVGNYLVEWNATNNKNNVVTSGIYFYEIKIAEDRFIGKMNFIK